MNTDMFMNTNIGKDDCVFYRRWNEFFPSSNIDAQPG
jgi:hypothetical protein